jgi:hypothetical protein
MIRWKTPHSLKFVIDVTHYIVLDFSIDDFREVNAVKTRNTSENNIQTIY